MITFDQLPAEVSALSKEISELKSLILTLQATPEKVLLP